MRKPSGDPMILLIALMVTAAIAALLAFYLGRWVERQKQEQLQLKAQVTELQTQVANLNERLNGRHLSNRAIAGLEDATAIAIDLVFEVETMEARLGNLRQVLGILRNSPEKYDPDRPSGYTRGV